MIGWQSLQLPLTNYLPNKTAKKLAKVDVRTVADLLEWFPRRYVEHGSNADIGYLEEGSKVTFVGEVVRSRQIQARNRQRIFTAVISDGVTTVDATFFNAYAPARDLVRGTRAMFVGTLKQYKGRWQLSHPDYKVIEFGDVATVGAPTGGGATDLDTTLVDLVQQLPMLPIYRTRSTSGKRPTRVDSWTVLDAVIQVLEQLGPIEEPLPQIPVISSGTTGQPAPTAAVPPAPTASLATGTTGQPASTAASTPTGSTGQPAPTAASSAAASTAQTNTAHANSDAASAAQTNTAHASMVRLPSLNEAIRSIHIPRSRAAAVRARQRLAFNEALGLQLVLALRRSDTAKRMAPSCPRRPGCRDELIAGLPFALTSEQEKVCAEISADLERDTPMCRLLQGDVGSGKTVVALIAMLQAVDASRQAALLAPTEVLAHQHAQSLTTMLAAAGVPVTVSVLTGSASARSRKETLLSVVSGQTDIVVGTHALLSDNVEFFDLGLVVIDEQHRFGVEQRDRLRAAGREVDGVPMTPHQLVMTATPIPRTVAMTTFGDLDVSTIKQLPGGRQPIRTAVVPEWKPGWVERAYERIREEVEAGRQAYIVCPRIEGEGGVEEIYEQVTNEELAGLRVGLLHGKLPPAEKDETMREFAAGTIDVLVSTTVIEVGVDVPNATLMFIREGERFGISQLHQLRGRVGRGSNASWCLIHTAQEETSPSYQRLSEVAATTDGFALAELDLRWRSEGDLLGEEQSGRSSHVQLLDVVRDGGLISAAKELAEDIVATDRHRAEELIAQYTEAEKEYLDKG